MASTINTNLTQVKKITSSSLNGLAQLVEYNFGQIVIGLQSFLGPNGITYDQTTNSIKINAVTVNTQANFVGNVYFGPTAGPTLTITPDGKLVGQTVQAPIVQLTRARFNDFNTVSNIGTPGIVGEVVYVGVNGSYDEGIYAYLQTSGWTKLSGTGGGGGGSTTLAGLTDVQLGALTDGNVLYFDTTLNKWTNSTYSIKTFFTGLSSLTLGKVPYWNGTKLTDSIISYDSGNAIVNVAGDFTATTKSFLIDHPTKKGYMLRYGNLEGPEHAVYVRGTNKGKKIKLPKHWAGLVDEGTITATITPIGEPVHLYVTNTNATEIEIGGATGKTQYFYTVFAERKDVPKLVTEFKNKSSK